MIAEPDSPPAEMSLFLPTVSVIIPIYNGELDLPALTDCLYQQTYPAERVEYLLVDNGSRDRTPQLIATAVAQASTLGLTFRYLSETDIQSAYAARNTGIRQATGEILAFTDADCQPQPNWLVRLVQSFENPAVGLAVGEVAALPRQSWLEKYAERQRLMSQHDTLAHPFCPYGQTANIAIRAAALVNIGLFRPHLTTGGDADMCWRLQREGGWQLHFSEDAVIQHRHRSTLKDLYSQWYRYGCSNRYLHELYGTELTRLIRPPELKKQIARWLLKEMPLTSWQLIRGRAQPIDLLRTPIGLYCAWARTQGQQSAQLSAAARTIARQEPRE